MSSRKARKIANAVWAKRRERSEIARLIWKRRTVKEKKKIGRKAAKSRMLNAA